jgi:MFS family permease
MPENSNISPVKVLWLVGLGTALSLIGDASLYAVLPTHATDAGITLTGVGIMLSANRFIRLVLNGPAGMAYDRWPRRPLFIAALFIGACSTAFYALTTGFWPLLFGRLLWGLAWAGIWVGGNTILVDISRHDNRGRWVGAYQISFFMGTSSGSIAGGFLTDWVGYHSTMGIGACLTFAGAVVVMLFLPETSHFRETALDLNADPLPAFSSKRVRYPEWVSSFALLGVTRLAVAGILMPTLGLFLLDIMGRNVQVAGFTMGVASATGVGLGITYLVSMISAPVMGRFSDQKDNRWKAAAAGMAPGIAGFGLLAFGSPLLALIGLPLAAFTNGSNQGLSTAIVGDLSGRHQRGRKMGLLFTIGDFAAAVGPPFAYAFMPHFGLKGIYFLNGALLALLTLAAWRLGLSSQKPLGVIR